MYFNRVGAAPHRAWIVRNDQTGRESYFSSVSIRVPAESRYNPRNQPPVPKAWLVCSGRLVASRLGSGIRLAEVVPK